MATEQERRLAFHRVRNLLSIEPTKYISVVHPSGALLTVESFDALFERDDKGNPTAASLEILHLLLVKQPNRGSKYPCTVVELKRFFVITKDDGSGDLWCETASTFEELEAAMREALQGQYLWAFEHILDLDAGKDLGFRLRLEVNIPELPSNVEEKADGDR